MHTPKARNRVLPWEVKRHPQIPAVAILRSAASAATAALFTAHPAVAVDRLSTRTEIEADHIVGLAQKLRAAIDNYRQLLRDDVPF